MRIFHSSKFFLFYFVFFCFVETMSIPTWHHVSSDLLSLVDVSMDYLTRHEMSYDRRVESFFRSFMYSCAMSYHLVRTQIGDVSPPDFRISSSCVSPSIRGRTVLCGFILDHSRVVFFLLHRLGYFVNRGQTTTKHTSGDSSCRLEHFDEWLVDLSRHVPC